MLVFFGEPKYLSLIFHLILRVWFLQHLADARATMYLCGKRCQLNKNQRSSLLLFKVQGYTLDFENGKKGAATFLGNKNWLGETCKTVKLAFGVDVKLVEKVDKQ